MQWYGRALPVVIVFSAAAWVIVGLLSGAPVVTADGPVVQILSPVDGFKLYAGQTVAVRLRVQPGAQPLQQWVLTLTSADGTRRELAHGLEPTDGAPVATLSADELEAGIPYRIHLAATDAGARSAAAELGFVVPELLYRLIPLAEGNLSRTQIDGSSVDASGNVIAVGGSEWGQLRIIHRLTGNVDTINVPLASTQGQKLTADGQRFLFRELLRLGFFDLTSNTLLDGPQTTENLFSADRVGRWIAFQSEFDLDPSVGNAAGELQYFLYDDATKAIRQLTADPQAIVYPEITYPEDALFCPRTLGTTPLITGDGRTVVFLSNATLGLVPPDPSIGCHVFAYDTATNTLRHVAATPSGVALDSPTISDDGRWLSVTSIRPAPPFVRLSLPALLDLWTGALIDPLGNAVGYPGFDSVTSGDGSTVVISDEADLDPRVGNADHNMELFAYDMASGRLTQITDTSGGIGRTPRLCPALRPRVNTDGSVLVSEFDSMSDGLCHVDGPQRNSVDGFVFLFYRAVRKRPGNHGPVFDPATQARVLAGETMQLIFAATDPDNDPITFFAQVVDGLDVPPGSVITDNHNGTATFTWPTRPEHAGVYQMRVAAFDEGGGEVFHDVTLAVCSRIVTDGDEAGVIAALFQPDPPPPCHDADRNHDGVISAADVVIAAGA